MKLLFFLIVTVLLSLTFPIYSQSIITFDNQGWSPDQSISENFIIDNFTFSSNKSLYTNYGYNFDVNTVSIYYAFQNPSADLITITKSNNELFNLASLAAYQVSETSTDSLVIEGWNGSNKIYSQTFANIISWQILMLNYDNINKIIFKLTNSGYTGISDFNFDNFLFNDSIIPVELIEFKARTEQDYITLEWRTATELNNYGFDIERKDSKTDWKRIGFVDGNGTTANPINYSFFDHSVNEDIKYKYRLKMIDNNGDFKYSSEVEIFMNLTPDNYNLSQNYPNPFNPSTIISYTIPSNVKRQTLNVVLKVYDILGNEVAVLVDEQKEAGSYSVTFDAGNLPAGRQGLSSGLYIYKLSATGGTDNFVSTKKMVLLK